MSDIQAASLPHVTEPTVVRHPAGLTGDSLKDSLDFWLRSGRDPHEQPPITQGPQATPGPERDDQSPWALLLPGSVDVLSVALDLGAEANRPVFIPGPQGGGHASPAMVVVAGPLDEASAKIRKLKAQDADVRWDGRWPGHDRHGDALIHLIVSAQFSDPSIRIKLAEAAICDLMDETLGSYPSFLLMRDAQGRTAVMRALELQRVEVATSLLSTATQAQAQAIDHQGRSALHTLAAHPLTPRECLPLVRTLVAHGASWDAPDVQGVTAAQLLDKETLDSDRDAWRNLVLRTSQR